MPTTRTKNKRNMKPPPTPASKKSRWNWDHVTLLVPILLEDGSSIPARTACTAKGGPHGPLELTPDNDRWPIVGDIPPTAVIPDRATTSPPA